MQRDLQKSNLSEKMLSCTEENDSATASWSSSFTSSLFPTLLKHCPSIMSKIPELSSEDSLFLKGYLFHYIFSLPYHQNISFLLCTIYTSCFPTQRNRQPMSSFLFCLSWTAVIHQQCKQDCCFLTELIDSIPNNDQWKKNQHSLTKGTKTF